MSMSIISKVGASEHIGHFAGGVQNERRVLFMDSGMPCIWSNPLLILVSSSPRGQECFRLACSTPYTDKRTDKRFHHRTLEDLCLAYFQHSKLRTPSPRFRTSLLVASPTRSRPSITRARFCRIRTCGTARSPSSSVTTRGRRRRRPSTRPRPSSKSCVETSTRFRQTSSKLAAAPKRRSHNRWPGFSGLPVFGCGMRVHRRRSDQA